MVWELDREAFAVGGARACAEYSQRMIPRYLPTVNRYLVGTSFETGTRQEGRKGRTDPPFAQFAKGRPPSDTALRLARHFKTNAEFWLNLQNFCDLEVTKRLGKVSEIERQVQPVGAVES